VTAVFNQIERLGIASLRELLHSGHDRQHILMMIDYHRIVRVRFGWYAVPGTDERVFAAWRVGGRLACVSALAYYGVAAEPNELHVGVRGDATQLRKREGDVIHWSRRPGGDDRRVVSLALAVRQASRCTHVTRDSL
jgi:hypothetical protein